MAFIDAFKKEEFARSILGMATSDAKKLLMITFLLNKVKSTVEIHKLTALYDKYNVGPRDYTYIGYE
jgi:hypothetical protein